MVFVTLCVFKEKLNSVFYQELGIKYRTTRIIRIAHYTQNKTTVTMTRFRINLSKPSSIKMVWFLASIPFNISSIMKKNIFRDRNALDINRNLQGCVTILRT